MWKRISMGNRLLAKLIANNIWRKNDCKFNTVQKEKSPLFLKIWLINQGEFALELFFKGEEKFTGILMAE